MDYLDKVYFWLGNFKGSQNEFEEYFKLDYSVEGDFDNPNFKICRFCKDIKEKWYDEDFIGYIKFDDSLTLIEILEEVPIDEDDKEQIIKIVNRNNIKDINAVYWYSGEIEEPDDKITYNGLRYIGEFNLD